jgi:hypothetical protein
MSWHPGFNIDVNQPGFPGYNGPFHTPPNIGFPVIHPTNSDDAMDITDLADLADPADQHDQVNTNNFFKKEYLCHPLIHNPDISDEVMNRMQKSRKIILPNTALEQLSHYSIDGPMVFKLMNKEKVVYATVEQFHGSEKVMFVSDSMMVELGVNPGERVQIDNVKIPKAEFIQFKPDPQFLQLTNPKIVLERYLRNYTILYKDQVIPLNYLGKTYNILVQSTKPADVVLIVDADIQIDFDSS